MARLVYDANAPLLDGLGELLSRSNLGHLDDGAEAHLRLADMISRSDIPEPAREYLTWMHTQIASGMDARLATAMMPRAGDFRSKFRDWRIYDAVWAQIPHVETKLRYSNKWIAPACRRLASPRIWRKYFPGEMALAPGTIRNVYRRVDKELEESPFSLARIRGVPVVR